MPQEQLGRLRGPKGRMLGQLECSGELQSSGASTAQDAGWAVERGLPLGLWVGAPANTGKELLVPGAQCHVPSRERCFPAWLQPPQTVQLQPQLALIAQ